ncbi:MAG: putative membrane protein [Bacteroidia bacterium]|jgi:uncharacterized membrane protein
MPASIGLLIFALACIVLCYAVAKKRGAKVSFWVVMGALFGPLAIPFVFFSKPVAPNNLIR